MRFTALWLLFSTSSSWAALVTARQTLDFDLPTTRYIEYAPLLAMPEYRSQSTSLTFAGFDPALGRLMNAYLSYQAMYGFEYIVKAGLRVERPPFENLICQTVAGMGVFDYELNLTASGAGTSTLHSDEMTTYPIGRVCSGVAVVGIDGSGPKDLSGDNTPDGKYLFQPWVTVGSLDSPLLGLADGLNVTGGVVQVVLDKRIRVFMGPFFSSSIDPAYSYIDNYLNRWYGSVAITYEYETVPEPGTLALMAIALIGLAGRNRRRC